MSNPCSRCGKPLTPITANVPLPAGLAEEVHQRTCSACWHEWCDMEVKVINELRLNFMDPASLEILHRQMREFLGFVQPAE